MSSGPLRVILSGDLQPATNMAIDEALLVDGGPATLRLYGWKPAGLSIGYFQSIAAFLEVPGQHDVVRRLTGGGAIYHGDEITFALTLDEDLLPRSIEASYAVLHQSVITALAAVGVEAQLMTDADSPLSARPSDMWCFATSGRNDIVTCNGKKLLGSAQRRTRQPRPRILHHGSLVMRTPEQTPFCASVSDQLPPDTIRADLLELLAKELAKGLDLSPEYADLSADETALADRLEVQRHRHHDHLHRR